MVDMAYRASIEVEADFTRPVAPASDVVLTASLTNLSGHTWSQARDGAIRLGNHWLTRTGHAMLVQDDGRAPLPETIEPGHTCRVVVTVNAPAAPGEYQLECDVVHEGISWFADKGSKTWRTRVSVGGTAGMHEDEAAGEASLDLTALALSDLATAETPGPLPMHGIHRDIVDGVIRDHDATLVHVENDERGGHEWIGYRYFVRKNSKP